MRRIISNVPGHGPYPPDNYWIRSGGALILSFPHRTRLYREVSMVEGEEEGKSMQMLEAVWDRGIDNCSMANVFQVATVSVLLERCWRST